MTRVLSGVVLGAAFFAIVWFGSTAVLLGVVDWPSACWRFREYAGLDGGARRGQSPRLLTLVGDAGGYGRRAVSRTCARVVEAGLVGAWRSVTGG